MGISDRWRLESWLICTLILDISYAAFLFQSLLMVTGTLALVVTVGVLPPPLHTIIVLERPSASAFDDSAAAVHSASASITRRTIPHRAQS